MNKPLFWVSGFIACCFAALLLYETGRHNGKTAEAARWRAEISRLNAEAAQKTIAQREAALAAEREAQIKAVIMADELAELEAENAEIEKNGSGGACGISAGRVRLLNRQAAD